MPDTETLLYEYGIGLPELDEEVGWERVLEMLGNAFWLPVRDPYKDTPAWTSWTSWTAWTHCRADRVVPKRVG